MKSPQRLALIAACWITALCTDVHGVQVIRRQGKPFAPQDCLWSRISEPDLQVPETEPTAAELAPTLGLVEAGSDHGVPVFRHEQTGMQFVFVPGGEFPMGSDYSGIFERPSIVASARNSREEKHYFNSEQPCANIYVSPFFIGQFEVTVAQYRAFLAAAQRGEVQHLEYPALEEQDHTPHFWEQEHLPFFDDDQPVAGVSWLSAFAFSNWMNARLPTEAEWEKAARGNDRRSYPWGNQFDVMRANTKEGINERTVRTGVYIGGRSPYGCYNMAGNVTEYTMDAYEETVYVHRKQTNHCLLERSPRRDHRVVRGGSWSQYVGGMHRARTTSRASLPMSYGVTGGVEDAQHLYPGFRVVLSPHQDLYPEGWLEERRRTLPERREARLEKRRLKLEELRNSMEEK